LIIFINNTYFWLVLIVKFVICLCKFERYLYKFFNFIHADLTMRSRFLPFSFYPFNLNRVRLIFGEHKHDILKTWIDLNYRMIRTWTRRQFLLQCKHNNLFPAHLSNMIRNSFHLTHYKSTMKFERSLHIFRTSLLNIEIFYLNRIIDSLTKELCSYSRILSDSLPTYIWNNITNYHFRSFK